jgi:hypothetical protein
MAEIGHHQRASDPAARKGRGPGSGSGSQPGKGWPQPRVWRRAISGHLPSGAAVG